MIFLPTKPYVEFFSSDKNGNITCIEMLLRSGFSSVIFKVIWITKIVFTKKIETNSKLVVRPATLNICLFVYRDAFIFRILFWLRYFELQTDFLL